VSELKGTFRDLIVWQKAIALAKQVYKATRAMPVEEKFGLTVQMRRAAVSIASNIAEGNARQTIRDYLQFLAIARGSLAELETQIIIAGELTMIRDSSGVLAAIQEVRRILQALMDSLRRREYRDR
jgi:four helix bundle protein